ncbi:MAG: phosphoserine transaminase [Gammaproteobacteria bacterium RIFCSPHIGHO2_12_FULL_43_28]|nr:MAG: phosphoserine transaminase [Gammaproteobacteria bacterium RIFCSPHIGHO2_12_FULL_43_28]
MRKVYNFSAGPAMLPEDVLLKAQAEMLDWNGTGMSIMELGHRGPEFQEVAAQAEADLRELLFVPDDYQVLFLPGGATTQFAMVPINLLNENKKADYIETGIWSAKAIEEAKRYGHVNIAASLTERDGLLYIPTQDEWHLSEDAAYVHYTPNETIAGVEFQWVPETGKIPLVADMTSSIMSQPIDVKQYGLIYAGAQKNIGQAGITIVIIRDELIKSSLFLTPTLYQYKVHAEHHSFYNTPPTYSWYIAGLMFAWTKQQGGVAKIYQQNKKKAAMLYDYIDQHLDFYQCQVHPDCRSLMNISFSLSNEKLTDAFLTEAEKNGLTNLRGHRIAGGVRASIYNAMPMEGVEALLHFMDAFRLSS